jgi:hypothetical protein
MSTPNYRRKFYFSRTSDDVFQGKEPKCAARYTESIKSVQTNLLQIYAGASCIIRACNPKETKPYYQAIHYARVQATHCAFLLLRLPVNIVAELSMSSDEVRVQ